MTKTTTPMTNNGMNTVSKRSKVPQTNFNSQVKADVERLQSVIKKNYCKLTEARERELIAIIQQNGSEKEAAKTALYNAHLPLIYDMVQTFPGWENRVWDLFNEGAFGLCAAMPKFDLSRKGRFFTYAQTWCFKYMSEFYGESTQPVAMSEGVRLLLNKVRKERQQWYRESGNAPTIDEIAERLGETRKKVAEVWGYSSYVKEVKDFDSGDADDSAVKDMPLRPLELSLVPEDSKFVVSGECQGIGGEDFSTEFNRALSVLSDKERDILLRSFSIGVDGRVHAKTLAAEYGVTEKDINHIVEAAKKKVRKASNAAVLLEYLHTAA